jgi:hypothetical protein
MLTNSLRPHLVLLATAAFAFTGCDGRDDGLAHDFDSLTLVASGGLPLRHDGDECNSWYPNTTTVDATSATLGWDICRYDQAIGHQAVQSGSRQLDAGELGAVRRAWAAVRLGNLGECGADKPTVTIDVVAGGSGDRYVEDFYGCQPRTDGRIFVNNIAELEWILAKLVNPPGVPL